MLRWSPSRDQMLMVVMCCEPYELATNIIKTWAESAANKSLPVVLRGVFFSQANSDNQRFLLRNIVLAEKE